MLKVENIVKKFKSGDGEVSAVNDVSFKVDDGAFVSIIGRSGSGKSTLLSMIGALDKPTSGHIFVDDRDITTLSGMNLTKYRSKSIGFVFQNYNLIPNLSAIENVMLPMVFIHKNKIDRKDRAIALLNQVGLVGDKQQRRPSRLSGGEQQRVAIARALANKPSLILADEPTGNLDTETGKIIFELLHKLSKDEKTTIVVVTHDQAIAGKTNKKFKLQDGKLI
jgi:putative ABC transport system ATP-binding protein